MNPIIPMLDSVPKETVASRELGRTGAYYLHANTYTLVPEQVQQDMEWIADKGTDLICLGILEQDLWSAHHNLALIIREASRMGMRVLAVPSRWAGLTAGAPKVPSMFSILNPHTWIHDANGVTGFAPDTSGVVSSIHWPETLEFFCRTLDEMYRQHPSFAGFIIDEPKAFVVDHSPKAIEALGRDAPRKAHLEATAAFYDAVCAFAKRKYPDKATLLFMSAHYPDDEIEACTGMRSLDYFGADGRPWDLETDRAWKRDPVAGFEGGKGKVLLSGLGAKFHDRARASGKKSMALIENHSLPATLIEPMNRYYPEVLALGMDLYLYYYYPRNVEDPKVAMEVVGQHIKAFAARHAGLV